MFRGGLWLRLGWGIISGFFDDFRVTVQFFRMGKGAGI